MSEPQAEALQEESEKPVSYEQAVKQAISEKSKTVKDILVKTEADKEVEHRVLCCQTLMDKSKEFSNKIKAIKPSASVFNAQNVEIPGYFTKEQVEEKKKHEDNIKAIEEALLKAFNENDFSKVKDLYNKLK